MCLIPFLCDDASSIDQVSSKVCLSWFSLPFPRVSDSCLHCAVSVLSLLPLTPGISFRATRLGQNRLPQLGARSFVPQTPELLVYVSRKLAWLGVVEVEDVVLALWKRRRDKPVDLIKSVTRCCFPAHGWPCLHPDLGLLTS